MTQYKGKVIDEPNEWVMGELIEYNNRVYIRHRKNPPDLKAFGIEKHEVIVEVIPESVKEVHNAK